VVETHARRLVLKAYFHDPEDPRDRLGTEYGFARFAWAQGVRTIPRPLAADTTEHLGVYEYVDGARPDKVDAAAVEQALTVLAQLNAHPERARGLPNASEACFSIGAHLDRVSARIAGLTSVEDAPARQLVEEALVPVWHSIRATVVDAAAGLDIALEHSLAESDRCISPSDFGFHNALVDAAGKYWFLDFEYAGWDDPAKLVGDFFCQPACPVPLAFFEPVVARISGWFRDPGWHAQRMRLLWPVYQLKWACILLNEFLPVASRRRQFAGVEGSRRGQQLERSQTLARRAVESAGNL